jgi:hypothetical protein
VLRVRLGRRRREGAHEGIVDRRHRAHAALGHQLAQAVDREDDVEILLEAGAVEVDRDMAHHQLVGRRLGWDDAIAAVARTERPVAALVQAGRRDDGDSPLAERLAGERRRVVVGRAFEAAQVPGFHLGQIVETFDHDGSYVNLR